MDVVAYDVPAWGSASSTRAEKLLYHEPARGLPPAEPAEHPLAARVLAYFRGERVSFEDVELDAEWGTPSSRRWPRRCAPCPGARSSRTASWPPRRPPRAPRAAGTFCAENNFPLVVPVTGRVVGGPGQLRLARRRTSAACSRWRASSSEPLRRMSGRSSRRSSRGRAAAGWPSSRRSSAAPGACTCAAAAASRSTSSWRAGRWRGAPSRSCAPTASPARSGRTSGGPSSRAPASSTSRTTPAPSRR